MKRVGVLHMELGVVEVAENELLVLGENGQVAVEDIDSELAGVERVKVGAGVANCTL